jgi:hypothetical protein
MTALRSFAFAQDDSIETPLQIILIPRDHKRDEEQLPAIEIFFQGKDQMHNLSVRRCHFMRMTPPMSRIGVRSTCATMSKSAITKTYPTMISLFVIRAVITTSKHHRINMSELPTANKAAISTCSSVGRDLRSSSHLQKTIMQSVKQSVARQDTTSTNRNSLASVELALAIRIKKSACPARPPVIG